MGLQVTSMPLGGLAVSQETPQEKRPPLPMEQAVKQAEVPMLGPAMGPKTENSQKPQFPELKQTAKDLEHISLAFDRRLKFEIDQESREILIKVIDNETDKVIKVLPPEELQRLHSRIRETIGFLFDRMV